MKVGPFQFSLPVPFASLKPVDFVCPLEQLLVLEVFAGVASLSHECRAAGFTVMSVDQQQHRFCKAKLLKLDLTKPKDQFVLLHACVFANIAYAHFAPPRATSSRAPPLRSEQHCVGFPWLQGQDRQRVHSANVLYALTLIAVALLVHRRAVVSVEGPSSSYMWFVLKSLCSKHAVLQQSWHSLQSNVFAACVHGGTCNELTNWQGTKGVFGENYVTGATSMQSGRHVLLPMASLCVHQQQKQLTPTCCASASVSLFCMFAIQEGQSLQMHTWQTRTWFVAVLFGKPGSRNCRPWLQNTQ